MTPNRASPHRKPAGGRRRRRQPDDTLVRSGRRPGPPIAPTSASLGARDRSLRRAGRDRSANQALRPPPFFRPCTLSAVGNRQIPIDPKAEPGPRGFLPWRLSDAGPPCCWLRHDRPASETLHTYCPAGHLAAMSAAEGEAAETGGKRTYTALTAGLSRRTAAMPGTGAGRRLKPGADPVLPLGTQFKLAPRMPLQ